MLLLVTVGNGKGNCTVFLAVYLNKALDRVCKADLCYFGIIRAPTPTTVWKTSAGEIIRRLSQLLFLKYQPSSSPP